MDVDNKPSLKPNDYVITASKDKPFNRGDYYDFYGSNSYYMTSGAVLKKIICSVEGKDFPLRITVEGDSFYQEIEINEPYKVIDIDLPNEYIVICGEDCKKRKNKESYIKIFSYESLRIKQETYNPSVTRAVINLVINYEYFKNEGFSPNRKCFDKKEIDLFFKNLFK